MSSPYPILITFCLYLWIVLKIGPNFMSTRKAFNLSTLIRLYNIVQVIVCSCFELKFHLIDFHFANTWKCIETPKSYEKLPENLMELHKIHWYYILLRMFEFFETIFFVLRKKNEQVSTLHVYHHISTVALLWIFLKYSGGMMELFIPAVNSLVHIIMYSYYFISSFKNFQKSSKLVKPFITFIQIIQLVLMLGQCIAAIYCNVSRTPFILQIINISLLLVMFVKFYIKTYFMDRKIKKLQ